MAGYTPDQYEHGRGRPHSHVVYGDAPIDRLPVPLTGKRVLDVGCGNGYWTDRVRSRGAVVTGIDGSSQGIAYAREAYPGIRFEQMLATETLLADLCEEPFDAVMAVEVIEHIFDPRAFVVNCVRAIKPGGTLVLSTPYHGFWKNLALSLANKWDFHHHPLNAGGHIKFFSRASLGALLEQTGLKGITFSGHSRVPYVWMGMVMSGTVAG